MALTHTARQQAVERLLDATTLPPRCYLHVSVREVVAQLLSEFVPEARLGSIPDDIRMRELRVAGCTLREVLQQLARTTNAIVVITIDGAVHFASLDACAPSPTPVVELMVGPTAPPLPPTLGQMGARGRATLPLPDSGMTMPALHTTGAPMRGDGMGDRLAAHVLTVDMVLNATRGAHGAPTPRPRLVALPMSPDGSRDGDGRHDTARGGARWRSLFRRA